MKAMTLPSAPGTVEDTEFGASHAVIEAVVNRRSMRRFLPDLVAPDIVRAILSGASRAPSGSNFQPWHVHVVTGTARERLSQAVLNAVEAGDCSEEYAYAPAEIAEPYLSRRRKVGHDLYKLYGIERDDYMGRKRAMLRNFEFFGAPVGLFFTMERSLLYGSWLDCGMLPEPMGSRHAHSKLGVSMGMLCMNSLVSRTRIFFCPAWPLVVRIWMRRKTHWLRSVWKSLNLLNFITGETFRVYRRLQLLRG
jgi:nitroreductase